MESGGDDGYRDAPHLKALKVYMLQAPLQKLLTAGLIDFAERERERAVPCPAAFLAEIDEGDKINKT